MHYLLRKQIIGLVLSLIGTLQYTYAQKQLYRLQREDESYYFGITIGYNSSYLHVSKSKAFLDNKDTILVAEPGSSGGITMGLLATARLTEHLQFRVNPQLIIGGARSIHYTLGVTLPGESTTQVQSLPSTLVTFPFQFKFNSDRIGNFRTYILGGIKYDIDLSSNSSARNAEGIIKLKRGDFGLEAGIGFNFYLPFVTISPEIKVSYGLSNIHQLDPSLKYSNVLDKIQSRMIMFSIHLED
jgi:hypothetical protein